MRRWGDVSPPWTTPAALALAAATFGVLLWLTRGFDFYFDEWDFVLGAPHWHAIDYFLPHNEHWSTLPALVYKVLLSTVGARSYTPYMAVLLTLHSAIAVLLYFFIGRRSGTLLGLLAAAMLLVLGRGFENILWAFQMGFLGSIFFGLAAWLIVDSEGVGPRRQVAASLSLVLSLMCSGVGLFFLGALLVELALDPPRRRLLVILAAPLAAYAGWFLLIGRGSAGVHRSPYSLTALRSDLTYVPFGVGAAFAGLFGVGGKLFAVGLAALAALLASRWAPPRPLPSPRAVALLAAIVGQFALTGLVRAQFGDQQAAAPRYVYIAAVFLLPLLAEAVAGVSFTGQWRRAALLLLVLASIAWSGHHLIGAINDRKAALAQQDAELETLWMFRDAPDLNRQAVVEPDLMPQVRVGSYLANRASLGSPLPGLEFEHFGSLPPADADRELAQVMTFALSILPAPAVPAGHGPGDGCSHLDPTAGFVEVLAQEGTTVIASGLPAGRVSFSAWTVSGSPGRPVAADDVSGGDQLVLRVPRTGHALTWHIRMVAPSSPSITLCPNSGIGHFAQFVHIDGATP